MLDQFEHIVIPSLTSSTTDLLGVNALKFVTIEDIVLTIYLVFTTNLHGLTIFLTPLRTLPL